MEISPVILNDLLNGSRAAWAQFVHASAPVIWGQVRRCFARYGGALESADLEDVSQDVYVRLSRADYRLLRRFDPSRAKLNTYLGIIAHSASVDFLRKRRGIHEDIDEVGRRLVAPEPKSGGEGESLLALLPDALLSSRQQLILNKLFEEDMDVEDLARDLGVEAQTIRSAKHKALSKIRAHFEKNPHLREAA